MHVAELAVRARLHEVARAGGVPEEPAVEDEPAADVEEEDVWKPTLTLELFDKLVLGMSYEDVQQLLGWPGEVLSDNIIGDQRITTVVWRSEDGQRMINGMFYDDALRMRGQRGLDQGADE